jgi:SPP1 gp7 family putative phage head morphogenesis protein
MKEEVLNTLKQTVKAKPEIVSRLTGSARWAAGVYAYKLGDPHEEERMKDERKLERKLRVFLEEQFDRVIREVRKMQKSVYQPSFWDSEERFYWEELSGDHVSIMIRAVEEGVIDLEQYSSLVDYDLINQRVIDYARQYRFEWIKKINDTTRNIVQKAVTDWLAAGDPLDVLINMLEPTFGKVRAARIAATEVTRLRAKANQIAWQESGVIEQFRWSTAMDDLVCQICAPNEGQLFPLSQMDSMLPAHVNCRCVGRPVVNEELLQQRREERWRDVNFD